MRKAYLLVSALAVLLVGLPVAASSDPGSDTTKAADPTFILGNVRVMKFRVSANGYTPQERWVMANKRIKEIMDRDIDPEDVNVRGSSIYIGNEHFVTCTAGDARANSTSPERLARIWAAKLRQAVAQADQT